MQWVQFTDIVLHPMIQSSVTRLIFLSASLMGKNTSNRYKPSFQWGKKGRLVDICWSQILNLAPWEERDGYWRAVGGGLIKPPKEAPCVTDKTKILNTPQFKSFPPWTSQRGSACTEENFKTHWSKPYLFWNLWDGTQIFNAFWRCAYICHPYICHPLFCIICHPFFVSFATPYLVHLPSVHLPHQF